MGSFTLKGFLPNVQKEKGKKNLQTAHLKNDLKGH